MKVSTKHKVDTLEDSGSLLLCALEWYNSKESTAKLEGTQVQVLKSDKNNVQFSKRLHAVRACTAFTTGTSYCFGSPCFRITQTSHKTNQNTFLSRLDISLATENSTFPYLYCQLNHYHALESRVVLISNPRAINKWLQWSQILMSKQFVSLFLSEWPERWSL